MSRSLPLAVLAALAIGPNWTPPAGYVPIGRSAVDTVRRQAIANEGPVAGFRISRSAIVSGYFSPRGLPPIPGQVTVSDEGMVLEPTEDLPARTSTISLAYTDNHDGASVYVFRVDAGVFETNAPGPLLDLAGHEIRVGPSTAVKIQTERYLVSTRDSAALWKTARGITAGAYADSLYTLFGHPRASVGLMGKSGRLAGRLGEYIASRDSLALDPGRMIGETQLRHTLAHELGHRWQAKAKAQIKILWSDVRPIRDPKRYGYGDTEEHQAEAIAFAVNFLQTTARIRGDQAASLTLLDHYELLVPGTRIMVRYLALQPIYRNHPLRRALTASQDSAKRVVFVGSFRRTSKD